MEEEKKRNNLYEIEQQQQQQTTETNKKYNLLDCALLLCATNEHSRKQRKLRWLNRKCASAVMHEHRTFEWRHVFYLFILCSLSFQRTWLHICLELFSSFSLTLSIFLSFSLSLSPSAAFILFLCGSVPMDIVFVFVWFFSLFLSRSLQFLTSPESSTLKWLRKVHLEIETELYASAKGNSDKLNKTRLISIHFNNSITTFEEYKLSTEKLES